MANTFFSNFPTVQYDIDGAGSFITLTDIVKSVDVNDALSNQSTYYKYYEIPDGARPDTISFELYDTPKYYWTLFILNNHLRQGLNAWPLSSSQFEKMLVREYDPYSVITFKPDMGEDAIGLSGLMQLVTLKKEYLPHLRLINDTLSAKILRYDPALLQLLIYDITRISNGAPPATVDIFFSQPYYKISWDHLAAENTDEWDAAEGLRKEFVAGMISIYSEIDTVYTTIEPSRIEGLDPEIQDSVILTFNSDYVFNKRYTPGIREMQWVSYRNAASEYYLVEEDELNFVSAYDILINDNTVAPTYVTYYEKELQLNDDKSKIKVLRKEVVSDFIKKYFALLNS